MLFEFVLQLVSHDRPPQKLRDIGREGGSSELGQTSSRRRNAFPFRYRDRNGLTGAFAKTTRLKPCFIIQTIDPVVFSFPYCSGAFFLCGFGFAAFSLKTVCRTKIAKSNFLPSIISIGLNFSE